jgi:hypothetical protein
VNPHELHVDLLDAAYILGKSVYDESCRSDIKKEIYWRVEHMMKHLSMDLLTSHVSHASNEQAP